jgi:hypothetical protein
VIDAKDVPSQITCIGGYSFKSFTVDTDEYLNFLLKQFTQEGGKVCVKDLNNLEELLSILPKSHTLLYIPFFTMKK